MYTCARVWFCFGALVSALFHFSFLTPTRVLSKLSESGCSDAPVHWQLSSALIGRSTVNSQRLPLLLLNRKKLCADAWGWRRAGAGAWGWRQRRARAGTCVGAGLAQGSRWACAGRAYAGLSRAGLAWTGLTQGPGGRAPCPAPTPPQVVCTEARGRNCEDTRIRFYSESILLHITHYTLHITHREKERHKDTSLCVCVFTASFSLPIFERSQR